MSQELEVVQDERASGAMKETKEVIIFLSRATVAVKDALETDGKIDLGDAGKLFEIFPSFSDAVKDITKIPKEIKDAHSAEFKELEEFMVKELGTAISKEETLRQINAVLAVIHAGFECYEAFKPADKKA